jgi:hypothetical protein
MFRRYTIKTLLCFKMPMKTKLQASTASLKNAYQLTNNTIKTKSICWNGKHCKRLKTCEFCLSRRLGILGNLPKSHPHVFKRFVTISLRGLEGLETREALEIANALRGLFKGNITMYTDGDYLCFLAAGEQNTPHIHLICEGWDDAKVDRVLRQKITSTFDLQPGGLSILNVPVKNPQATIGYLMDTKNYQGALMPLQE